MDEVPVISAGATRAIRIYYGATAYESTGYLGHFDHSVMSTLSLRQTSPKSLLQYLLIGAFLATLLIYPFSETPSDAF